MQDYRKLRVWQQSHRLALSTYELPAYLRSPEAWPLRDQVLRAGISVPSNIAEGAGRGSNADFRRFCWHSMGSCNELESDLILAGDLKLVPPPRLGVIQEQICDVRRMLTRFMETLT